MIRMWDRRLFFGAPIAVLLLATSRPLDYKKLTGSLAEAPSTLTADGPPTATFGENPNNQACNADERLDLQVRVDLRNDGVATIVIDQAAAEILVDGEPQSLKEARVSSTDGKIEEVPFREYEIAPGETEVVFISSYAFMPRSALESVDQIEVSVPVDADASLRVIFSDIRGVPTLTW